MDHLEHALFYKFIRWQGPKIRAHFRVADQARKTGGPTMGPPVLRAAFWSGKWSLFFWHIGNL